MKRIFIAAALAIVTAASWGATLNPIQLLNPVGSTAGQAIISTGPATAPAWTTIAVGNVTGAAPLTSPALLGIPTSPTAAISTYTDQIATTKFVLNQASSTLPLINGTAAIGTSASFARADHVHPTDTTRAPLASPTFSGTPSLPTGSIGVTQTAGNASTALATTAFVTTAVANQAAIRNQPFFQAYLSANQSFTAGTLTKVQFNTKNFDSGTNYDATTNFRYTPQVAGKYLVTVHINEQGVSTAAQYGVFVAAIYKNGASVAKTSTQIFYNATSLTIGSVLEVVALVQLNGTTDYIEGWGNVTTVTTTQFNGGADASYIQAIYVGP